MKYAERGRITAKLHEQTVDTSLQEWLTGEFFAFDRL